MNIPPKGELKDYNLPSILIALNREKASGTLFITTPHFTKNIYIKDGNVIFASSSLEEDRLGRLLVRAGKITEEQYNSSFEKFLKTTGMRHGTILVAQGFIKPADLIWGVQYQVRDIINSIFQVGAGDYEFKDGFLPSKEVITLNIDTGSLIYEAVSRVEDSQRIKDEFPDAEIVFCLNEDTADMFNSIKLNVKDMSILSLVDGKRTIKQVAEEASMDFSEVLKSLYSLHQTNLIVEREEKEQDEPLSGEKVSKQMSKEEVELREKIDNIYARLNRLNEADLLHVDRHMSSEEVKKNYHMLAKEFHPDRTHNSADKELKDKLTVIFAAMANAYGLLRDDAKRKEYFNKLKKMPEQPGNAATILIKEQVKRGIQEFRDGNYKEAAEIFKWLTDQRPEDPKLWSYLSHVFARSQNKLKEAETAILKAMALSPLNSEYVASLGLIYQKAGLNKRARAQLEKAVKLDPENERAKKGLEEIGQAD